MHFHRAQRWHCVLTGVMCSLKVCLPGGVLEAEAREANESCACESQPPTHKATAAYKVHYSNTPLNRLNLHLPVFVAQNNTFLLGFFHTVIFHKQSNFLSELLHAYYMHLYLPKLKMLEGEDAKWKWLHKVSCVIPPCFTAERLTLKSAFPIHSLRL